MRTRRGAARGGCRAGGVRPAGRRVRHPRPDGAGPARGSRDRPPDGERRRARRHGARRNRARRPTARRTGRARSPSRGETMRTVTSPVLYTPKAPTTGTDDYRCFVLDPKVAHDAFVTGFDIAPGQPAEVHHVILFRVPPSAAPAARAQGRRERRQRLDLFRRHRTGLARGQPRRRAVGGRLGARRPRERPARRCRHPVATRLAAHHAGALQPPARGDTRPHLGEAAPVDVDEAQAARDDALSRTGRAALSRRQVRAALRPAAAIADVTARFGPMSGPIVNGLLLVCNGTVIPTPGPTQSCTRQVEQPATIRAVAGHMHLLGSSLRIELDPGTPRPRPCSTSRCGTSTTRDRSRSRPRRSGPATRSR